jgi:hypothetical protein
MNVKKIQKLNKDIHDPLVDSESLGRSLDITSNLKFPTEAENFKHIFLEPNKTNSTNSSMDY